MASPTGTMPPDEYSEHYRKRKNAKARKKAREEKVKKKAEKEEKQIEKTRKEHHYTLRQYAEKTEKTASTSTENEE